jgi:hypothetical protein
MPQHPARCVRASPKAAIVIAATQSADSDPRSLKWRHLASSRVRGLPPRKPPIPRVPARRLPMIELLQPPERMQRLLEARIQLREGPYPHRARRRRPRCGPSHPPQKASIPPARGAESSERITRSRFWSVIEYLGELSACLPDAVSALPSGFIFLDRFRYVDAILPVWAPEITILRNEPNLNLN